MIATSSGRSALDPVAFEVASLPPFLFRFVFFQRIGIQIDDFQPREVGGKVAEGHPKLAIAFERQADLLLLIIRDKLPLWRSARGHTLCK